MSAEQTVLNTNLDQHALTLGVFIATAMGAGIIDAAMMPTVYVEDSECNQATHARLVEKTLTDGSKVWNIVLTFEGAS